VEVLFVKRVFWGGLTLVLVWFCSRDSTSRTIASMAADASSTCSCAKVKSPVNCSDVSLGGSRHTALQLQSLEFFVLGFDCCILFLDCRF
jgi:hypothetical protein